MSQRILVISDHPETSNSLINALNNHGFTAINITHSLDSIDRLNDILPNVIIMEDHLSLTGSIDLCKQICYISHTPLILIGEGDVSRAIRGLERGADFYIKRPISALETVARVKALLRRYNELKMSTYLLLDSEDQTAILSDRTVKLTATEFRLLSYLLLNRNRVIPKEELLSSVWKGQEVTTDTVKFYVSRLRNKLNHSTPHNIFTHRGVGYRLSFS